MSSSSLSDKKKVDEIIGEPVMGRLEFWKSHVKNKIIHMCKEFYKSTLQSCMKAIDPIIDDQACKMAQLVCNEVSEPANILF
ncbi:hypothetical protein E2562_030564 [Oryza meyeriana var. granulata]|uniref:Uncharacterized protein n=1 Tax=Oryza meyeriana var. granulata TaxID=110450 RepID=A0A6G1D9D6_9ORYZ|nr:hypothetical protein E2562_030564 [Oryza meyeriana var. granulata]